MTEEALQIHKVLIRKAIDNGTVCMTKNCGRQLDYNNAVSIDSWTSTLIICDQCLPKFEAVCGPDLMKGMVVTRYAK